MPCLDIVWSIHKSSGIHVRLPLIVHIFLLYTRKLGLLNLPPPLFSPVFHCEALLAANLKSNAFDGISMDLSRKYFAVHPGYAQLSPRAATVSACCHVGPKAETRG
jgi:hypothetical protein